MLQYVRGSRYEEEHVNGLVSALRLNERAAAANSVSRCEGVAPVISFGADRTPREQGERAVALFPVPVMLLPELNDERQEAAGLFTSNDPELRDESERQDHAERDRAFVNHCADHLTAVAAATLDFAIELLASLDDDKPRGKASNDAIDELRGELLDELATHAPPLACRRWSRANARLQSTSA